MQINYRRELYRLLKEYDLPKIVAEIGVAEGLFSRDMLKWGLDLLYCVDNWATIENVKGDGNSSQEWHDKNYENAKALMKPWDDAGKVVWLKGLSHEIATEMPDYSLGMLYLDADHSLEGVTDDLNNWFRKVIPGGIVAGHDYLNTAYGVKEAVYRFCFKKYLVHLIPEDKAEDAGFWFRTK